MGMAAARGARQCLTTANPGGPDRDAGRVDRSTGKLGCAPADEPDGRHLHAHTRARTSHPRRVALAMAGRMLGFAVRVHVRRRAPRHVASALIAANAGAVYLQRSTARQERTDLAK